MRTLIIASLLPGDGATGVEAHIRSIVRAAVEFGIEARLVTPYSSSWLIQKACNRIVNLLRRLDDERAHLLLRHIHRQRLRRFLRQAVVNARETEVTIYAQDPLSAAVALDIADNFNCRVAAVAHFNKSEAEEFVSKGVTRPGASLWRELMETDESVLPKVDTLIFVSRYMRDAVQSRIPAVSRTECAVLPNICPTPEQTEPRTLRDAVCIGSLEPRKNQRFILRVVAACNERGRPVTLDVIGDGEDRETLASMARDLGIDHLVRFLGKVPNASAWIPGYRVLLHAAHMESFGIVLTEAMAHGVPVIAAPVGGIPEVFSDGVEGLYWDTSRVDRAVSKLLQLLDDPVLQSRLCRAARLRASICFSPEALSARWLTTILAARPNSESASHPQSRAA